MAEGGHGHLMGISEEVKEWLRSVYTKIVEMRGVWDQCKCRGRKKEPPPIVRAAEEEIKGKTNLLLF